MSTTNGNNHRHHHHNRLKAIQSLVEAYEEKHNNNNNDDDDRDTDDDDNFFLHPGIEFVSTKEKGIALQVVSSSSSSSSSSSCGGGGGEGEEASTTTTTIIEANCILLRLPQEEQISVGNYSHKHTYYYQENVNNSIDNDHDHDHSNNDNNNNNLGKTGGEEDAWLLKQSMAKLLLETENIYHSKMDSIVTKEGTYTLKHAYSCWEVKLLMILTSGILMKNATTTTNNNNNDDSLLLLSKVIETWPTYQEMLDCFTIYELRPEVEELLRGTCPYIRMERVNQLDRFVFDEIIQPVLLLLSSVMMPPSASEEEEDDGTTTRGRKTQHHHDQLTWWEAYHYASLIMRSRSHEGERPREPVINPLIDMINGHPYYSGLELNQQPRNVRVVVINNKKKKTKNRRGASIITLQSTTNICSGQELVLSYGDHTPTSFVGRYGFCPKEIVTTTMPTPTIGSTTTTPTTRGGGGGGFSSGITDEIILRFPVDSMWVPPDALRSWACKELDRPSTIDDLLNDDSNYYHLTSKHLDNFTYQMETNPRVLLFQERPNNMNIDMTDLECPQYSEMKDYIVLNHLLEDDEAVKLSVENKSLEDWNDWHLSHLLQLIVDHVIENVTTLGTSTNEEDLRMIDNNNNNDDDNDNDPPKLLSHDVITAYRLRICQRDALARWRHAFCWRFYHPSEHSEPQYDRILSTPALQQYLSSVIFHPKFPKPKAPNCLLQSGGCRYCGRTIHLHFTCSKCTSSSSSNNNNKNEAAAKYCCHEHQLLDWPHHKSVCNLSSSSPTNKTD